MSKEVFGFTCFGSQRPIKSSDISVSLGALNFVAAGDTQVSFALIKKECCDDDVQSEGQKIKSNKN